MSLVAYGSSDESENEEEINKQFEVKEEINKQSKVEEEIQDVPIKTVNINSKLNLPTPKTESTDNVNNTNESDHVDKKLNFNAIPKPVPVDIAKTYITVDYSKIKNQLKKEKGPTKISIPSLSDFKDLDEENEQKRFARKPSEKGSGLINMLPPPKQSTVSSKTNSFIPHVLTAKPVEIKKAVAKKSIDTVQRIQKSATQSRSAASTFKSLSCYNSDSDSEDDHTSTSGIDFFSLSAPIKTPDEHLPPISKTDLDTINALASSKKSHTVDEENKDASNTVLVSNVMNLPKEEILLKNQAEVGPKLPIPEQEYNIDSKGNVAFDDKAIEYLCGKRGVKRKNDLNSIDIVEINGEDIKPDEREWMVKALTEEVSLRPVSVGAGPSGKSKKKHQITYLAHQAKAMELELKNQWAQNKASRQQTRSKYGF